MKYELNIKPLQLRQPKMYDYYMSTCDFYYLRYEDCEIPMFKFAFEEMIKNPKKTDEYKKIFIDIYNETFLQPNTDAQKLQMFLDYLSPKFIDVRNIKEAARAAANALKAWRYVIFDAQWYADNVFIDDKITPPILIKSLSEKKQASLYKNLTEKSLFLPIDTDYDSFCFVFGNDKEPNNFIRLEWQQNKQLLRELITELKHPDIEISKNKYTLPPYFNDKKKKNIDYLPTNKPKPQTESEKLKDIVKKMRQTN